MGFKKLTLNEINYAKYNNLIGAAMIREEFSNEKVDKLIANQSINSQKGALESDVMKSRKW